jgi:hypothetical protein
MRPEHLTYTVNGNEVTCELLYYIDAPNEYHQIFGSIVGKTVGVAKCHPDDTFSEETGRKIALAKAEAKAYLQAKREMEKRWAKVVDTLNGLEDMFSDFTEKAVRAAEHNKEYIERITQ